jgi:hypothetical protein
MNTSEKTIALAGGKTVTLLIANGPDQNIFVRQLPLRDYDAAFKLLNDEIGLTAFCALSPADGKPMPKETLFDYSPENYEALFEAAKEVNANGFFLYSARRLRREEAENLHWARIASELPPETLKAGAISATSSPKPPRPRD